MEKCSELGAEALLPVLTERSPTVGRGDVGDDAGGSGRQGRWDRLAQASSKQCLRTHKLRVLAPAPVARLEEAVRAAQGLALLATQGGAPLHEVRACRRGGEPCGRTCLALMTTNESCHVPRFPRCSMGTAAPAGEQRGAS